MSNFSQDCFNAPMSLTDGTAFIKVEAISQ
jgi:hypothetical protein